MFGSPPYCMLCNQQTGHGLFKRVALICKNPQCVKDANAASAARGDLRPQKGLILCYSCAGGLVMKTCPRCGGSVSQC